MPGSALSSELTGLLSFLRELDSFSGVLEASEVVGSGDFISTSPTLILLRFVPVPVDFGAGSGRMGVDGGGERSKGNALSTKTMDFSSRSSLSRIVEGEWMMGGRGF